MCRYQGTLTSNLLPGFERGTVRGGNAEQTEPDDSNCMDQVGNHAKLVEATMA
jgi:hypothetical protein